MKRESFNIPGHVHFLTFSCPKTQRLLTDNQTCPWLAEAIDEAHGPKSLTRGRMCSCRSTCIF